MKMTAALLFSFLLLNACQTSNDPLPITGTWQLLTGTLIENGDTSITDYTKDKKFIKIINDSHFAFLNHDLNIG